ncbi:MAG: Acetoin:2,6-dichlorophenolindophenol oxidoreductase subunit alpha [Chlamydiia bacterium]|nr:Acetoin:2,6-dichlorophenolindophenol oxidoreductase subunit alpha [Chlamydiia bacterium]MCH9615883.1 Acetoin:2,6-dichlorophenolindophenol oxidoreductase subunit alpha [Chlamydiia bacterium]MCH9628714.1 Acetoin:2,6-dichlorophenolindophenol oxidoreductase subunit alpha [Chlamydiia bacterium]
MYNTDNKSPRPRSQTKRTEYGLALLEKLEYYKKKRGVNLTNEVNYNYFQFNRDEVINKLGKDKLLELLDRMLLIRNFETRAEAAYQQGKVGGFFHAYMGQEAIQTAAIDAGEENFWWTTTYRCHAMAILLGETPDSLMAELYGKEAGNAMGRGGSMHFYSDRMLGGFGIVGGHLPVATGAGFSIKYQEQDAVSVCFLGDGSFVQGVVHESLNLASLWDLPCLYVIENNQWGMGTAVDRAVCVQPIAESFAPAYGMKSYTVDGMDIFACYAAFEQFYKEIRETGRPLLVEFLTERFRGHSISDPALYRPKEELQAAMQRDPILHLVHTMEEKGMIDQDTYEKMNAAQKEIVKASLKFAEESPFPSDDSLEEGVFVRD